MPPTGPTDAAAAGAGLMTTTQAAPLAYAVLTLEGQDMAAPQLEAAPRELVLALRMHTVGRVAAPLGGKGEAAAAGAQRHFVINNSHLSAAHCTFAVEEGEEEEENDGGGNGGICALSVRLTDTSSNGTFVNGALLGKGKSVVLQDGDLVTLFRPKKASLPALSYVYSERPEGRTAEARKVRQAFASSSSARTAQRPSSSSTITTTAATTSKAPAGVSPTKKLEENMRQENARLSARVAAVEAELSAAKSKAAALSKEKAEMAEAHERALASLREAGELEAKAAAVQATLEEKQGAAQGESERRTKALEEEAQRLRTEKEQLEVVVVEKGKAVRDLQQDKLELEAKVADLGGSLATERRELTRLKSTLEKEVGKGKALSETVEALKAEKQAWEDEMHKLQTELKRTTEEAAETKRALDEHDRAMSQAAAADAEVAELRLRLSEAEGEKERKGKELERVKQRLSEQEGGAAALVAEKNEFRAKCDELQAQLQAAQSEATALGSKAETAAAEARALGQQVSELTVQHKRAVEEGKGLTAALAEAEAAGVVARKEVLLLRERVSVLEAKRAAALEAVGLWRVKQAEALAAVEEELLMGDGGEGQGGMTQGSLAGVGGGAVATQQAEGEEGSSQLSFASCQKSARAVPVAGAGAVAVAVLGAISEGREGEEGSVSSAAAAAAAALTMEMGKEGGEGMEEEEEQEEEEESAVLMGHGARGREEEDEEEDAEGREASPSKKRAKLDAAGGVTSSNEEEEEEGGSSCVGH